jgi:thioesterase domain-containing protein/non-ribosomal peptide synthetase component F
MLQTGKSMATVVDYPNSDRQEPAAGAVYAMPATPLQARLWHLNRAAGNNPAWNVAVRFRLAGDLDRDTLERSFQSLANRHEALRTSLESHDGNVAQRIASRVVLPIEWCDLRGLNPEAQAEEVRQLSLSHAMQPLPLDCAPLLRVRVLRLNRDEHVLLWNTHHSVCDGSSVGLLAADWMHCYAEILAGREPETRDSLEYADYAVWLAAQRGTPAYESHRKYWNNQLRGLSGLDLPSSWRSLQQERTLPVIQSTVLPRSLTDRIARIAQDGQATFFHSVLAGFAVLMHCYRQSPEVILGTPLSGRDQAELETIVGAFVNYLPLRLRVEDNTAYDRLLQTVRDLVTDCFDHSQYRYEDMLADSHDGNAGLAAESSLFSAVFICQQDFVRPVEAGGLTLTALPSVSPGALRPLTVFLVERADGWRLSCEVDNRTVSAAAGAALLKDYERLLAAIAEHPNEMVTHLAARAGIAPAGELESLAAAQILPSPAPALARDQSKPKRIPATEAQVRFWMLDRLKPGDTSFDLTIRLELRGSFSPDALRSAAAALVERNEILRTTLEEQDEKIWQVVRPQCPLDFRFDIAENSDRIPMGAGDAAAFSLSAGPLFRIRLVQLAPELHELTITLSHAIADGWSSGVYLQQLGEAYQECLTGIRENHRTFPAQFAEYAAAERKLLAGAEKDHRLAWWEKRLEGSWLPLALPRDIAPEDNATSAANRAHAGLECVALDSGAILSARRFARDCNSTLFAVFGAAFQALLARYSGQADILFLTPFANRTEETESVLGPLAVPVCVTAHVTPQTTFRELVAHLSSLAMDATENVLPFGLVAPLLDMRVVEGRHALNQISFFHQRAFVHDMQWGALEVKNLPHIPGVAGSEWQLGVVERNEGFTAEFLYDAAMYSASTMSLVGSHYARLLSRAIQQPDAALSQLQIASSDELEMKSARQRLLPASESILRSGVPSPSVAAAQTAFSEVSQPALASQASREMLRIWRQLFNTDQIKGDSDFFDLGGHSLLLARLQILVKKRFSVALTVADVFRHPTLNALTGWLERNLAGATAPESVVQDSAIVQDPRVVPIQPSGPGRPVFVISQSMIFRTLAAELGLGQPMFALQMLDEDVVSMVDTANFDELAAMYVGLIRRVQPAGPYRLAGWCVSGWTAYAIAQKLEAQGEKIEMLMVIDTWAPGYWRKKSRTRRLGMQAVYRTQRLRWVRRRLSTCSTTERNAYIRGSIHGMAAAAARNLTAWLHHRLRLPLQVRLTEEMRLSEQVEYTASRPYEAGPLRGEVLLFRSGEQPTGPLLAPDMGWSEVIGRPVEVQALPGDHQQIFDLPGARMMAARVAKVLDIAAPALESSTARPSSTPDARPSHSRPMVEA